MLSGKEIVFYMASWEIAKSLAWMNTFKVLCFPYMCSIETTSGVLLRLLETQPQRQDTH